MHHIHQHKKIDTATGQLACRVTKSQKPFFFQKIPNCGYERRHIYFVKKEVFHFVDVGRIFQMCTILVPVSIFTVTLSCLWWQSICFSEMVILIKQQPLYFWGWLRLNNENNFLWTLGKFFFFFKKQVPLKYILYNLE